MTLPAPLAALGSYRQFIRYYLRPKPDKPGKTDKVPIDWRTGYGCDLIDPASWGSYDECAASAHGDGVGFVFTDDDPFWFLDVDHCFVDGHASPIALDLYHSLPGAAWEVSQSGLGLHAFGCGSWPADRMTRSKTYGIELYRADRFCALTCNLWGDGGNALNLVPAIADVARRYLPERTEADEIGWTTEPANGWDDTLADDAELIRRMLKSQTTTMLLGSRGPGGARWTVQQLWAGEDIGDDMRSEADAALAAHLAFWTGKNCEAIERLMLQSALARDKWHTHRPLYGSYLRMTIAAANAQVINYCKPRPVEQVLNDGTTAAVEGAFSTFINPPQFPKFFNDCAYVISENKIYTPTRGLLSTAGFDTVYGGHVFVMDAEGSKTSTSAWEAFRTNQMWRCPIADGLCFRPEERPGALIEHEDQLLLNRYKPIDTLKIAGDPKRFLDFLAKLMPMDHDRLIILSYMAAMVQNPGRKFQWWPVIQGAEGNGKTALLRILSHAVGHRYTHLVNPEAMAKTGNQFNAWIEGHLFVGIEEIYMAKRRDFLETFKSTVTNDRIGIEGKGEAQRTGDNRANGLMLTNHMDAIPVTVDTRRYAVFFTAQQHEKDLERDGMSGDYFPELYEWLRGDGRFAGCGPNFGYAIVAHYLANYVPDPRFNPAGACQRAPRTTSFVDAVQQSLGRAEQEVQEAIDEARPGFAGGWVSSHYLDMLLERIKAAVPRNKRRALMQSLGYDWHPALGENGRVNNIVLPDGNKPRLYIHKDSAAISLATNVEVSRAYGDAQRHSGS